MNKLNTKNYFLLFLILFLVLLALVIFYIKNINSKIDKKLYISINNVDVTNEYINISNTNSYPQNIKIETEYGYNDLLVYEDKIACTNSDCKDKICVNRKFIHKNFDNEMIVCAPHKLIIYYK